MYFYGMEHTDTLTISKFIIKNHKPNTRGNIYSGRYSKVFNILNADNLGFWEGYCEADNSPGMVGNDYHLYIDQSIDAHDLEYLLEKVKGLEFVGEIEM